MGKSQRESLLKRQRSGSQLALLVGATVSALVLSACAGNGAAEGGETEDASSSIEISPTTAAPTGDLDSAIWALNRGEPATLDWIRNAPVAGEIPQVPMCESLMRMEPDFSITPGLAESVDNPDPTTWIYHLRDGVQFHDGSPMTADDVAFSLDRAIHSPDSIIANAGAKVESITATGPLEVTVKLTELDVMWNQQMSLRPGQVHKASFVEEAGESYGSPSVGLMCTGPYKFESWEPGKQITITANENYWNDDLRPKVGKFEMRFLTDTSALTNSLKTGEVDGGFALSPVSFDELSNVPGATLSFGPSMEVLSLAITNTDGPLGDLRIRQALSMVVDRQAIVDTIYRGAAEPVKSIISPAMWGYETEIFQEGYDALPEMVVDLEAAAALVEEAGSPSDPIVVVAPSTLPEFAETARAIQSFGEQIGLNIETKLVSVTEFGALFGDPQLREGIDIIVTASSVPLAEPLDQTLRVTVPGGARNYSGYDNPAVTEALQTASRTADDAERARLIVEAQEQFTKDLPWIPIASVYQSVFQGERLTGAPASISFINYPWAGNVGAR
ncbi:MAG: ABC transporter substrate-binding protein [Candidatus Leucobacter sulfamidivorax]|nr:ABC transporter substrate-binding protein [Candidatus Leucobacter sulfamidivorax]